MTEGPPPSEATSSKASNSQPHGPTNYYSPWYTTSYDPQHAASGAGGGFVVPNPPTTSIPGLYQPYSQTNNPYAAHYTPHAYYPLYQSQPTTYISQTIQPPTSNSSFLPSNLKSTRKPPSPPPSPPLPDPETYKHWDAVICAFFHKTGLTQALKGFEADMLVLNPEWEQIKIPLALQEMIKDLTVRIFLDYNFWN